MSFDRISWVVFDGKVTVGALQGFESERAEIDRETLSMGEAGGETLILITGGTGHLGTKLVRRLPEDGHKARILVREQGHEAALAGLEVERVYGDLRDPSAISA